MTDKAPQDSGLIFALEEELGNPQLFAGRVADLTYFLEWSEKAKRKMSNSHAILARRRRGKTALMQRLYNALFTLNDPQIIPFYIRVPDEPITRLEFVDSFYRRLITQYFAFKLRRPELNLQHFLRRAWA